MRLAKKYSFLTLQRETPKLDHIVRLVPSIEVALKSWVPSTRISPLFGFVEHGTSVPSNDDFNGKHYLIFLGPIHPERVLECDLPNSRIWCSLGLYNVFIATSSEVEKKRLLRWARTRWKNEEAVRFESWTVIDGHITSTSCSIFDTDQDGWRDELVDLARQHYDPELLQTVKEYCPLIASCLSRSTQLTQDLSNDFQALNIHIKETLSDYENGDKGEALYPTLGQLTTIITGLSRFTSQTFSGTSPIVETECHLRSNSLLGIGIANLALARLRRFIQMKLGSARIPERFALLASRKENVPNLSKLKITDDFWTNDHLDEVELPLYSLSDQVPLLSYFSARDGYRSTLITISAPLSAVSSCNTVQWSLLTITHELSHVIIRGVLAELYPDIESDEQINDAFDLLSPTQTGRNLLEEIRRLLLLTIIKMDDIAAGREDALPMDKEVLISLLEYWYREVEEIFVHVFDFMYFYGEEVVKYVEGIWVTWGTIPNIVNRVREYVVRTVCTVLVRHLRRGKDAEEFAKEEVYRCLTNLKESSGGSYIDRALVYLTEHWEDEIKPRVLARKQLVKIARTFLFSTNIAANFRSETGVGAKSGDKEGYNLRPYHLEQTYISNPLRFIEFFTKSKVPSSAESAWMLYVLAFCVQIEADGRQ